MRQAIRSKLRDARYALPGAIERRVPGQSVAGAVRTLAALERKGLRSAGGYFHAVSEAPDEVARVYRALAAGIAAAGLDSMVAIKANALGCEHALVAGIAEQGAPIVFDAMAPQHADAIIALAEEFSGGVALPARWQRTASDAARLKDGPCRIRLVAGEWADPDSDVADPKAAYCALARRLAGRKAPVAVATHDPVVAEAALTALAEAGTPCELEQLRGLPAKRTSAAARRLGVPVRLYYPFGPGWLPYAVNSALARPYLPIWALRDALALQDPRSISRQPISLR